MRVAAVQMTSTADKAANLTTAERLVTAAAGEGAALVVLPEMFNCLGSGSELRAGAEPLDGQTSSWAGALARDHGVVLVAGSFVECGEKTDGPARNFNTSCVYTSRGERVAVYRKIH